MNIAAPTSPLIELRWPVMGDRVPADHNYRLYSALIDTLPALKEVDWQLGTIRGIPDRGSWVKLGRDSILTVRCPLTCLPLFRELDNKYLRIGQSLIELSELTGQSLQPARNLTSRLTIIKLMGGTREDSFQFAVSVGKQLQAIGVTRNPELGKRGAIVIKDNAVVGYGLSFVGLQPEESIALQTYGLGGKRKMGCGVFLPEP